MTLLGSGTKLNSEYHFNNPNKYNEIKKQMGWHYFFLGLCLAPVVMSSRDFAFRGFFLVTERSGLKVWSDLALSPKVVPPSPSPSLFVSVSKSNRFGVIFDYRGVMSFT